MLHTYPLALEPYTRACIHLQPLTFPFSASIRHQTLTLQAYPYDSEMISQKESACAAVVNNRIEQQHM